MKEALKGIEADLTVARNDVKAVQEKLDEKIERVTRLENAKALLRGENLTPKPPEPQEKKKPSPRRRRRVTGRAKKKASTNGHDPAKKKADGSPTTVQAAAAAFEASIRKDGDQTERQLAERFDLTGRGGHNIYRAALRSLVAGKVLMIANGKGPDALYTLTAKARKNPGELVAA